MRKEKFILLLAGAFAASAVMADEVQPYPSQSGDLRQLVIGSMRAVSAVSAVPLSVVGASLIVPGAVSMGAAAQSFRAITKPIGTPLPVTDDTITATPPNMALLVKNSPSEALKTKSVNR